MSKNKVTKWFNDRGLLAKHFVDTAAVGVYDQHAQLLFKLTGAELASLKTQDEAVALLESKLLSWSVTI